MVRLIMEPLSDSSGCVSSYRDAFWDNRHSRTLQREFRARARNTARGNVSRRRARLVQRPCGRFQEGRTSALTPVHLEAACFVRRRTGRSLQRRAVRIARRACACFRKTHAAPLEAARRAPRIARRTCFRRSMLRMRALSTSRKTSAAKKATILRRMRVLALLLYLKFRIRWERGIEKKRAKRRAAGLVADAADDDDEEEVQERRVEQKNVKQKMAFS